MKKNNTFRRAAALMAALSITVSLAAPAFADTYYIDYGDITITKNEDGSQTIKQGVEEWTDKAGEETVITTSNTVITTLESDLEGPAAEDSGFGPVVEDNYQPAQPEDAEKPEGADQPESTEKSEDADRQESADQQAAPAAAPAASTPKNDKGNGFWGNTITVINNFANTVLNLTLKDVKIDVSDTGGQTGIPEKAALSVQGKGNVEIELDGDNVLKSATNKAGLEKNESDSTGMLTLKDDKDVGNGSLKAEGGGAAAGIGGDSHKNTKNITITGGTVEAVGGSGGGAGIGGGENGSGKNITINGGTVNAKGGSQGAGIGGGSDGSGENITINSGTVTAAGGSYGAGIGGGYWGDYKSGNGGKDITINGGTVTATGGYLGAGIGGGGIGMYDGYTNGENITINGGTVTATGGDRGAGIGGGSGSVSIGSGGGGYGSGKDITINGGTVIAAGGKEAAGIGGGDSGSSENITITGGTVTAKGGEFGAGIGGGESGSGSNVTVSGAAQVTATAGKSNGSYGAGATIGNGGSMTDEGDPADGEEIQADISGLTTTGYIRHIIYKPDLDSDGKPDGILKEWWEPERPQPNPGAPAEESNEVDLGTPGLHVETLEGDPLPFDARQQGSTLRVTSDTLAARLHGTRQALEALREQGVEQIQFVTSFKTTTLSVEDLLAEGGSWFALEHNGLVSRQLSAAQAESLKCRMR